MSVEIKMIVAYANDRVIGHRNTIPWKLSGDMKHFKETTLNHVVVMGRKTFESLSSRPLPLRINVVLTHQNLSVNSDVIVQNSVEDVLSLMNTQYCDKTLFVIGGGEIYKQFLPLCTEIIATEIHKEIVGDVHFPALSDRVWTQSEIVKNEENGILYDFVKYRRF